MDELWPSRTISRFVRTDVAADIGRLRGAVEGAPFRKFIMGQINSKSATESMIEEATPEVVHDQRLEVIGDNGSVRRVRKALKDSHVLRYRRQFSLGFLNKMRG